MRPVPTQPMTPFEPNARLEARLAEALQNAELFARRYSSTVQRFVELLELWEGAEVR
jgi:hypothetical protein